MININIYYSLRKIDGKLSLRLFSDGDCARYDQLLYGSEGYGSFSLTVEGIAYIDAVTTIEEYIDELLKLPKSEVVDKILGNLCY